MNKTISIIITAALVVGIGIILMSDTKQQNPSGNETEIGSVQNVEVKDGIQYVTILAHGGYSPKVSTAKAGIPTKLIVQTDGTYDCSSSLVIRSIGFQKVLPQSGKTEIDLGTPKSEEPIQGVCGMGMYNFQIKFL